MMTLGLLTYVIGTQRRRTFGRNGLSAQCIILLKKVFATELANRRMIDWLQDGVAEEGDKIKYPQSIETL